MRGGSMNVYIVICLIGSVQGNYMLSSHLTELSATEAIIWNMINNPEDECVTRKLITQDKLFTQEE